jgi:hypothetical protein
MNATKIRSNFERSIALFALVVVLLFPIFSSADTAAGMYPNRTCDDRDSVLTASTAIVPVGGIVSWCPSTAGTLTQVFRVNSRAGYNWIGDTSSTAAGTVTLTFKKCSGLTTPENECKNTLTDTNGNTVITSADPTGYGILTSGTWLVTANATAASGRLELNGW